MARYIDAEKLLKDMEFVTNDTTCPLHIAATIDQTISLAPTADVVEVVRCKDCLHKINYKGRAMCTIYGEEAFGTWYGLNATRDEHFCSYGERRDT